MNAPIHYYPGALPPNEANELFNQLDTGVTWESQALNRRECFLSRLDRSYTYGTGRGERTYRPHPVPDFMEAIWAGIELACNARFELCFLNGYASEQQHLGWHADNLGGMDHDRPIAVVSLGAEREIWFRQDPSHCQRLPPVIDKQLLEHGSALVMKPGMQRTHQHRIPKHPSPCGPRISLTFRGFK